MNADRTPTHVAAPNEVNHTDAENPDTARTRHSAALDVPRPADTPECAAVAERARPVDRFSTVIDGRKMRQLRCQLGLSQFGLADLAQVGLTTVARLERHHRAPCRTWTLARIAIALGERPEALRG